VSNAIQFFSHVPAIWLLWAHLGGGFPISTPWIRSC